MLIFVFGVKQKPIFILFHVDIQLFQHHLLKKKVIYGVTLASLQKISWPYMCGLNVKNSFLGIRLFEFKFCLSPISR